MGGIRNLALSALLLVACSKAAPLEVVSDGAASDGHVDAAPLGGELDIHTHCAPTETCDGAPCCSLTGWKALAAGRSDPGAVLLSLEHFSVLEKFGPLPTAQAYIKQQNRTLRAAGSSTSLLWFASLPCWYGHAWGAGWLAACKAEVDALTGEGVRGFKDHVGKTFPHAGLGDPVRWLGAWNRANGLCSPPATSADPNGDCLLESTVRYPPLEDDYRELVRHAVEDRRAVWLTHIRDWGGAPDVCHDPLIGAKRPCAEATKAHLLAFAEWASKRITDPAARRRIVVAHLGFLTNDTVALGAVLAAGLSVDTSANIKELAAGGCGSRELLAKYPDQVLFGSDADIGAACLGPTIAAWRHVFTGAMDDEKTFEGTCSGTVTIRGLDLDSPAVAACKGTVPAGLDKKILRDNARAILGL